MAGNPAAGGGNPSGFNVSQMAPMPVGNNGGGHNTMGFPGESRNPLLSPMPSQQQWPGVASPYSFSANGSPAPMPGINMGQATGVNADNSEQIRRAFHDAGVPSGLANLMMQFMKNGAGYNPQVLQQLFAQLQPQINRGEANIMEQFGSMGMGMSSPAAIGMGDFLSQVNLNEGQMASQLYEQSIQNYMQVLLGGSGYSSQDHPGWLQGLGEKLAGQAIGAGMSGLTGGLSNVVSGTGSFGGGFGAGMKSGLGGG